MARTQQYISSNLNCNITENCSTFRMNVPLMDPRVRRQGGNQVIIEAADVVRNPQLN